MNDAAWNADHTAIIKPEKWITVQGKSVWKCDCGSENNHALPCSDCPRIELIRLQNSCEAGKMIDPVVQLDHATTMFSVSWDDVDALTATGLKILKEERDKAQAEQFEKQRNQ